MSFPAAFADCARNCSTMPQSNEPKVAIEPILKNPRRSKLFIVRS